MSKIFTPEEVAVHNEKSDTQWIIVEGKVIDVTQYKFEHPGNYLFPFLIN